MVFIERSGIKIVSRTRPDKSLLDTILFHKITRSDVLRISREGGKREGGKREASGTIKYFKGKKEKVYYLEGYFEIASPER